MNESLEKSIDSMIDELFSEDTEINKSHDISHDSKTTADAVVSKAPKAQDDASRGAGRPKQISDVPKVDMDGKRDGEYDEDIASDKDKEKQPEEAKKQADDKRSDQTMKDSKGSDMPMVKKSVSDEDWAEFEEFKKAKAEKAQEEKLEKAKKEQEDLIKSIVEDATKDLRAENEELKKSLNEQVALTKAMAERPERRKSINNIAALEKSARPETQEAPKQEYFSKSEMLDVAEDLALNKSISGFKVDHVTELENTGFIYEDAARKILEDEVRKRAK